MTRLRNAILALALVASIAGCAATGNMVSKDTKIKCPKCGATFTVAEGIPGLQGP